MRGRPGGHIWGAGQPAMTPQLAGKTRQPPEALTLNVDSLFQATNVEQTIFAVHEQLSTPCTPQSSGSTPGALTAPRSLITSTSVGFENTCIHHSSLLAVRKAADAPWWVRWPSAALQHQRCKRRGHPEVPPGSPIPNPGHSSLSLAQT